MSKGITFANKQEASDYMKRLHNEGYVSKVSAIGRNEYKVTILETIKEYESKCKGLFKKGEISLPAHSSTRTKLHELGHKFYKHKPGTMTLNELARDEIEAESYAYEKMDKEINWKVGIPAIVTIVESYKYSPQKALSVVGKELRKKDITISEDDLASLVSFVTH